MGSVIYIPKKDNPIFYPEYGALYNWYAATDARNIASAGWHISSFAEWTTLQNYNGGYLYGGSLKETGIVHWATPNTDATNVDKFNGRGSGIRLETGIFGNIKHNVYYWAATQYNSGNAYAAWQQYQSGIFGIAYVQNKKRGHSLRIIKDSTTLTHGQTGTYTGNDGKVYRTICIGTQEWLADNLCETRFRNGDIIPWHGATPASYFTNAEWAALTTAGVCAYDNTLSNVATGFTFPT